jgi:hypothetical protein
VGDGGEAVLRRECWWAVCDDWAGFLLFRWLAATILILVVPPLNPDFAGILDPHLATGGDDLDKGSQAQPSSKAEGEGEP